MKPTERVVAIGLVLLGCGGAATHVETPASLAQAEPSEPVTAPGRWDRRAVLADATGVLLGVRDVAAWSDGRLALLHEGEVTWSASSFAGWLTRGSIEGSFVGVAVAEDHLALDRYSSDEADHVEHLVPNGLGRFGAAVDSEGVVHACITATDGSLHYLAGDVDERIWDGPIDECDLALDAEGRPHVAWSSLGALYVGRRGDAAWERDALGAGSHLRLALGPDGTPTLVVYDAEMRAALLRREGNAYVSEPIPFVDALETGDYERLRSTALAVGREEIAVIQSSSTQVEVAVRARDGRWDVTPLATRHASSFSDVPRVDAHLADDGRPSVAYLDASTAVVAHYVPAGGCLAAEVAMDGLCCFEGQHSQGGRCRGTPICPEGFLAREDMCTPLAPPIALATRGCADEAGGADPIGSSRCIDVLGVDDVLAYASERCARGDAPHCYVAFAVATRSALVSHDAWVEWNGHAMSVRTVSSWPDSRAEPGDRELAWLRTACEGGGARACWILGLRGDDAAPFERACRAGDIASCTRALTLLRADDPRAASVTARVTAACEAGDRRACTAAAFVEARAGAASTAHARARLTTACGLDVELPRTPEEDGVEDDPSTIEDERLEPPDTWSESDLARVQPCAALVLLDAGTHARLPATSAARAVLAATCALEGYDGPVPVCTALAASLSGGLGGPRDPAGAAALADQLDAERIE